MGTSKVYPSRQRPSHPHISAYIKEQPTHFVKNKHKYWGKVKFLKMYREEKTLKQFTCKNKLTDIYTGYIYTGYIYIGNSYYSIVLY